MINPTRFDLGRKVVFILNEIREEGTIVSFNEGYVYVQYATSQFPKGTLRKFLEWKEDKGNIS